MVPPMGIAAVDGVMITSLKNESGPVGSEPFLHAPATAATAMADTARSRGLIRICILTRSGWDSNPRTAFTVAGFQDRCLQPLGHHSKLPSGKVAKGGKRERTGENEKGEAVAPPFPHSRFSSYSP